MNNKEDEKTQESAVQEQEQPATQETELEKIMKENAKKKAELAKRRAEDNKTVLKSYRIK